ncbi:ROK family protein [Kribbella catacumbae]|uniref:ROK family protein n=1 Tax=Kribbella catacumbae TaxID=460086 RepID=UPI00192B9484|nr:ROK family protein [Kribbella catacumbae]
MLNVVRARGPVARSTIAAQTGLSPATITGISAKLVEAGLLVETQTQRDTGGRPARLLDLGDDRVLAAGVRLSSSEASAVLVNLRGEVVATGQAPLASTSPDLAAEAIVQAVDAAAAGRASATLLGVGVAISGVVDHAEGIVRHSGALGWETVPFQAQLAEMLDAPVVIDSYANSLTLGLLLFDRSLDGRDLLVFSVATSLGASVVVGGHIHRGFNGSAGGFAHSRVDVGDGMARPCHCGATDCLECWGSRWGIEQELKRRKVSIAELGREPADEVLAAGALQLGKAMANAAKIFGPEQVVLAFAPEMNLPGLTTRTEGAFRRQYDPHYTAAPHIEVTVAAPSALASGAAYVLLAQLFTANLSGQHSNGAASRR